MVIFDSHLHIVHWRVPPLWLSVPKKKSGGATLHIFLKIGDVGQNGRPRGPQMLV